MNNKLRSIYYQKMKNFEGRKIYISNNKGVVTDSIESFGVIAREASGKDKHKAVLHLLKVYNYYAQKNNLSNDEILALHHIQLDLKEIKAVDIAGLYSTVKQDIPFVLSSGIESNMYKELNRAEERQLILNGLLFILRIIYSVEHSKDDFYVFYDKLNEKYMSYNIVIDKDKSYNVTVDTDTTLKKGIIEFKFEDNK